MKRGLIVLTVFVVALASACGDDDQTDIDIGNRSQVLEIGPRVVHSCLGSAGYVSDRYDGGLVAQFPDPYCLGVYDSSGTVNTAKLERYIAYLSAVQIGDAVTATAVLKELVAQAPRSSSSG